MNKIIRWLLFGLGLMVMLACSPPSYVYDVGITQFCRNETAIIAYQSLIANFSRGVGEPRRPELRAATQDGGMSWKSQAVEGDCAYQELKYPFEAGLQLIQNGDKTFQIVPYDGIYRTTANDEAVKEFDLSQLYHDARFLYFSDKEMKLLI